MADRQRVQSRASGKATRLYSRELGACDLISQDEEKVLGRKVAAGDTEARDRFIRANLRLVIKIAKRYKGRGLPIEDLIQEGNLGLLRAVDRFDPERGVPFASYAQLWIRQAIQLAFLNQADPVHIPINLGRLAARWRRVDQDLTASLGRPALKEEIAQSIPLSKEKRAFLDHAIEIGAATRIRIDSDEDRVARNGCGGSSSL